MNNLDIKHPSVNNAFFKLKETNTLLDFSDMLTLFEETYKCKVHFADHLGAQGNINFKDEKQLAWFLLQNSENNITIK